MRAPRYPLPDEPFVAAWEEYAREAEATGVGVAVCLRRVLVQLRFPIAPGVSESASYRAATRRGVVVDGAPGGGACFRDPGGIRLLLHPTAAGRVPVVIATAREDFVTLVRALTRRNEPAPVPEAMGACIVAGYNNWERVTRLRTAWEAEHPADRSPAAWSRAFQDLIPKKELYQDRFILLSAGPYSATPADALGLPRDEWLATSLAIRLEHECTHYFTRRAFGRMQNVLLDELVADYMGIVLATGRYRADWFLRFVGLESYPEYRVGGRLENYRGEPPLSDGAFAVLQSVVCSAADNLQLFDAEHLVVDWTPAQRAAVVTALCQLGLEGVASECGVPLLEEITHHMEERLGASPAFVG
jgi:hypothetical protein